MLVGDAHKYLLKHYHEFDFIWSSPPCFSHSQFRQRCGVKAWNIKPLYPDMKLYEEIIFLQYHAKCPYVVENVEPYYKPLIPPQKISRHYFWSNFTILKRKKDEPLEIKSTDVNDLQNKHGINLDNIQIYDKRKLLRNCVEPELGLHIFECAFRKKQKKLDEIFNQG